MSWHMQTPDEGGTKLISCIAHGCVKAESGAAAFAFASSMGIKILFAEAAFSAFVSKHKFRLIVGLDAITDLKALTALKEHKKKYNNFEPHLFLHDEGNTCFHPKTMWFRNAHGGITITGSGNLTVGGLRRNWEALTIEHLDAKQIDTVEKSWRDWEKANKKWLVDLDDTAALNKASQNRAQRIKIKQALALPKLQEQALEGLAEEVESELALNPILIAEVPKSGDRWKQVNFSLEIFEQFFGVTLGKAKTVRFYHVRSDGTLDPAEVRQAVSVKSQNYRFEVGAVGDLPYPTKGHPILVFEKIDASTFKYVLLMPGEKGHKLIQGHLDHNYSISGNKKRRIVIAAGELQHVWPDAPLFD